MFCLLYPNFLFFFILTYVGNFYLPFGYQIKCYFLKEAITDPQIEVILLVTLIKPCFPPIIHWHDYLIHVSLLC